MFLTTNPSPLSAYDMGAIGLIFLLAAGLLKILSYMIRKKFEGEKCKALEEGTCPLEKIRDQIKEMYDLHCSPRATGQDGIPHWYVREDMAKQIREIHETLQGMKDK